MKKEVDHHLFLGSERGLMDDMIGHPDWRVIHACKEPYHRRALGYTGRTAPQNHPEYLYAYRSNRLILNLIDPPFRMDIPRPMINEALNFIEHSLNDNKQVFIHCSQGVSRSPSITLLYLAAKGKIENSDVKTAMDEFSGRYPRCIPSQGMKAFLDENWNYYMKFFHA